MQWMLPVIIEKIAWYLSPQDIAACCGVSTHWRQVFGSDQVWKCVCDPELEEYLRTTPCVVHPAFSVPGEQDSTLAPLSRWRTAFLREQHLWKNWRNGKCRAVELRVGRVNLCSYQFVSNDFLLCFYPTSVELWDVKVIPPISMNMLNLNKAFSASPVVYNKYRPVVYNNNLVAVKYNHSVEILKINEIEGTIATKYHIFYDDAKEQPVLVEQLRNEQLVPTEGVEVVITPGNKCIAYALMDEANVPFHIWNLETGEKLKEELCPSSSFIFLLSILESKTCEDVLVLYGQTSNGVLHTEVRVFDVEQLQFLPFKQTVQMYSYQCLSEMCAITKNVVAISDYDDQEEQEIIIINYRTGHQLHKLTVGGESHLDIINNSCFVFKKCSISIEGEEEESLCLVECPSGRMFHHVTSFKSFKVIGKNLVVLRNYGELPYVWNINELSTFKTPVDIPLGIHYAVNQACTRLVTSDGISKIFIRIGLARFW